MKCAISLRLPSEPSDRLECQLFQPQVLYTNLETALQVSQGHRLVNGKSSLSERYFKLSNAKSDLQVWGSSSCSNVKTLEQMIGTCTIVVRFWIHCRVISCKCLTPSSGERPLACI